MVCALPRRNGVRCVCACLRAHAATGRCPHRSAHCDQTALSFLNLHTSLTKKDGSNDGVHHAMFGHIASKRGACVRVCHRWQTEFGVSLSHRLDVLCRDRLHARVIVLGHGGLRVCVRGGEHGCENCGRVRAAPKAFGKLDGGHTHTRPTVVGQTPNAVKGQKVCSHTPRDGLGGSVGVA
jgi:hypothetical protein